MLVLVAGITGNFGQMLTDSLLARGHRVRGLARDPAKMDGPRLAKLESFIKSENYYDIPALDCGCKGVDAVVCTYPGQAELQLEGNLLLLRAAERAGIRVFVTSTYNGDWRNMQLGQHESYDALIALRNHAELSSDIKPIYMFVGIFADLFFARPGFGEFSPRANGAWDKEGRAVHVWGTGDEIWHWTTYRDAAEFTAAIVGREDAAQGGFWSVCSGAHSLKQIAETYGRVKGCTIDVQYKGTVDQLREIALAARKNGSRRNYWGYLGWFYQLYIIEGAWALNNLDNDKLDVKPTTLEEYLRETPGV
ncbi:NAD(P)-binding protein [Auricularia subglabra TFB-10046 SS5]|nr:NAD(P)-binding protein [Auricularia subglabra TFB-10046 SS5]